MNTVCRQIKKIKLTLLLIECAVQLDRSKHSTVMIEAVKERLQVTVTSLETALVQHLGDELSLSALYHRPYSKQETDLLPLHSL